MKMGDLVETDSYGLVYSHMSGLVIEQHSQKNSPSVYDVLWSNGTIQTYVASNWIKSICTL